jgi:ketosteroid isomerase-like protein
VRQAFLANLGKESLLFTQGKVVDGLAKWTQIPAGKALLDWWPIYADVSVAGDLGYTTGPFQFFQNKNDTSPIGIGFYSTVWRKGSDGIWKVVTDLGISTATLPASSDEVASPKNSGEKSDPGAMMNELQSLESEYTNLLNESFKSFHSEYLAEEFRIHRPQKNPVTSSIELPTLEEKHKFVFKNVGLQISASGDLALAYGEVKVQVDQSDPAKITSINYIRVWKKMGGQWKIVLDVIGG